VMPPPAVRSSTSSVSWPPRVKRSRIVTRSWRRPAR
jgi:hypothetical protein